jgi:ADP-glucose pyrophosphorylase
VTETIIWDNVNVDAGARIHRCVLGDNVTIANNEVIENAIVVHRELIEGKTPPAKALPGYFYGENFVVTL